MSVSLEQIEALRAKAETGEQWAEVCRLEAEFIAIEKWAAQPHPCLICGVILTAGDTIPCGIENCVVRS